MRRAAGPPASSRRTAPATAGTPTAPRPGSRPQFGLAQRRAVRIATQTAAPQEGEQVGHLVEARVDDDVDDDGCHEDEDDDARAHQSMPHPASASLLDRRIALLLHRRRHAEDHQRHAEPTEGFQHLQGGCRRSTSSWSWCRRPRCRPCRRRWRRRDDGRQVADVHLAAEHRVRHRRRRSWRGDVVQEARQHEHHHQQQKPPFQSSGR